MELKENQKDSKVWITLKSAAERKKVTRKTIYRWVWTGKIPKREVVCRGNPKAKTAAKQMLVNWAFVESIPYGKTYPLSKRI